MSTLARAAAVEWAKTVTANPMTVFLDTETLGKPNDSEICDIGIVGLDGRVWFDELIRPSIPIPDDAIAIHGITNEMVAKAPPWSVVATAVGELLRDKQIIIFNADYDARIRQIQRRSRLEGPVQMAPA
jgi:DNA polymerase-3 subunit epsilon